MAISIGDQLAKFIIDLLYFVGLYFSLFWLSVLLVPPQKKKSGKKSGKWPGVTIIVPMYDEENTIEGTLKSIFALDYPKNKLRVICVNDGSHDNTVSVCKTLQKRFHFELINQKNKGKFAAVNVALEKTTSPFFACFDADSYTEAHSLKNMIAEFDDDKIGAVLPVMKVDNPQNVLQRMQWLEYLINIYYKSIMGELDCIHVTPGPFSIYRTDVVHKLGNFNRAHMAEDLELALRLQENDYIIRQSLTATIHTKTPPKLKGFISQRTRWYQGTLLNVRDYKHFLFNKKYGDFGLFHMPLVAVTGILTFAGVTTAIYLFIKAIYNTFKGWYLTGFDFLTYIKAWTYTFTLLDINFEVLFTGIVLFSLTAWFIYLSLIASKERISQLRQAKYFVTFAAFFSLYQFILGYIWMKVLFRLIFKRENKWDKVN